MLFRSVILKIKAMLLPSEIFFCTLSSRILRDMNTTVARITRRMINSMILLGAKSFLFRMLKLLLKFQRFRGHHLSFGCQMVKSAHENCINLAVQVQPFQA